MTTGSSLKALPSGLSVPIAIESVPIARVSAFFGKADEGASETWRCALVGSPHHAWVKLDNSIERDAVLGFLMQRIQYTTENLMQRFGFPQLELRHGNTTRPLDARLH